MTGPLAGFRVLDMTQYVAGPLCTQMLADLGADVVKVERPPGGDVYRRQGPEFVDGESLSFLALNRGKRSVVIDVKDAEGRAVLERLLVTSDAFVHNFRPGTVDRLGLGRDDVARIAPKTIWATMSGYGGLGPRGDDGGYDLMMQGESGLMAATGHPDRPPAKAGFAVVDITAGVSLALGITAALLERERSGTVRSCESSLYETSMAMGLIIAEQYLANGTVPGRSGSASTLFAPYQAFRTADGHVTVEGTGPADAWTRFCAAIEAPGLEQDESFVDNSARIRNREKLVAEVEERTFRRSTDYWLDRFRHHGLPCGSIQDIGQALESEQTGALGIVVEAEHASLGSYRTVRNPLRFSSTATAVRGAPVLGEHTAEVLRAAGYDESAIVRLADGGVVFRAEPAGKAGEVS
ncbi:CaiB/BaiF CoA transferase family protein [Actinophytocola sp.]|uniref:CaiB/BaiF CoA transferase family protein n=1 Tax=Actinophytocola sp. TaxID=1872138 RepID=UPI003D6ACA20